MIYIYIESSEISVYRDTCNSSSNISINETHSSHTVIQGEHFIDIDQCLSTPKSIKRYFIFFIYMIFFICFRCLFYQLLLNTYII